MNVNVALKWPIIWSQGHEYEILTAWPFAIHSVGLITVEHNYEQPKRRDIALLLAAHGYSLAVAAGVDDWYAPEGDASKGATLGLDAGPTAGLGPAHSLQYGHLLDVAWRHGQRQRGISAWGRWVAAVLLTLGGCCLVTKQRIRGRRRCTPSS